MGQLALFSFFFAPNKGILVRQWKRFKIQRQLLEENLLKAFYRIGENSGDHKLAVATSDIRLIRNFAPAQLSKGLRKLKIHGYVEKEGETWKLSNEGFEKGNPATGGVDRHLDITDLVA